MARKATGYGILFLLISGALGMISHMISIGTIPWYYNYLASMLVVGGVAVFCGLVLLAFRMLE